MIGKIIGMVGTIVFMFAFSLLIIPMVAIIFGVIASLFK